MMQKCSQFVAALVLIVGCGQQQEAEESADIDSMIDVCIAHKGGVEACNKKYGGTNSRSMIDVCIAHKGGVEACNKKYGGTNSQPPARSPGNTVCDRPRSEKLPQGQRLFNPMPGGAVGGYAGDTGLDIMGLNMSLYAVASGTIEYSERGHTSWTRAPDTPNSVRIRLDTPLTVAGKKITHIYYTHMMKLQYQVREGSTQKIHVNGGDCLGTSGLGNRVGHLHLGFIVNGLVSQNERGSVLSYTQVASALGTRNGLNLPSR